MKIIGTMAAIIGVLVVVVLSEWQHEVSATSNARGMASDCGIDNDAAVEANVAMSTAEWWNFDNSNSAVLFCRLPVGSAYGFTVDDVDTVELYVNDGHGIQSVSAELGTHGTGTGVWTSCGTRTSPSSPATGDATLSWTSIETNACVTGAGFSTRKLFVSVTLPPVDATDGYESRAIGWKVDDDD